MIKNLVQKYTFLKNGDTANSMMLAFTQSIVALLFIVVDFVFSKRMDVEKFGIWKQLFFFIGLMVPLLSFGVPEGFKYYIAKEGKYNAYFSNMFFMLLASTAIGVGVLILLNASAYFGIINLKEYYLVSLAFPICFFVFNLNKSFRYLNISEKKVWLNTRVVSIYFLPTLLSVLLLGYYYQYISEWYLWAGLLIYILVFGSPLVSLFRTSTVKFRTSYINTSRIRNMLKVGLPLYLASFIGVIIVNFDKGIVTVFESKEAFALFSVGAMEIPVFAMLSAAFSQQTYPALVQLVAKEEGEKAKDLWIRTTLKVSFITYPLILILIIFAKPLIFFIYSSEYEDAVSIFKIYLLVGLLRNNYYGALITASGNTKFITYYSILTLVTNAIFSLGLYWWLGLDGIVYGTLLSTIIIALLQLRHEHMVGDYISKFLLNKKIMILILLILFAFIFL